MTISVVAARYITPAARKTDTYWKFVETSCSLRSVSSPTVITDASEVFLTMMIASLDNAGAIDRSACGSTTRRRMWNGRIPSAAAASRCVCFTDCRPPRKISAMKATSLRARPTIAVTTALVLMPMSGRTLYQNRSCSRIGVPRMTQM